MEVSTVEECVTSTLRVEGSNPVRGGRYFEFYVPRLKIYIGIPCFVTTVHVLELFVGPYKGRFMIILIRCPLTPCSNYSLQAIWHPSNEVADISVPLSYLIPRMLY